MSKKPDSPMLRASREYAKRMGVDDRGRPLPACADCRATLGLVCKRCEDGMADQVIDEWLDDHGFPKRRGGVSS